MTDDDGSPTTSRPPASPTSATNKQDVLLELAVFCLALVAMATLDSAQTLPATVAGVGYVAALGIATATGLAVLYEIATFDVAR